MKRVPVYALCLALAACASHPRRPQVRLATGTGIVLGMTNAGEAVVPSDGLIVFQGDDLFYGVSVRQTAPGAGGAEVSRSAARAPDLLFQALDRRVNVQLRTFPGDTVRAGLQRWANSSPEDLLVVSYAYGDAVAGTPVEEYRAALATVIEKARAVGTPVFLVVPPTSADPVLQRKVDPYRWVLRSFRSRGVGVFEANDFYTAAKIPLTKTVAQTDAGYRAIAAGLVPYIRLAPPRPVR